MTPITRLRKKYPHLTPPFAGGGRMIRPAGLDEETGAIHEAPMYEGDDDADVSDVFPSDVMPPIMRMPISGGNTPNPVYTDPANAALSEPMTRPRRVGPRDVLADESQYLSDLQSGMTSQNPIVRKPSKLQTALGFAASFLQGGLPGAAQYGIQRFNPGTYQNAEIGATEDRIGQEMQRRKLQNQMENDQSMRTYRGAQAEKMSRVAPEPGFTLGDTRYGAQGDVIARNPRDARAPLIRERTNKDGSKSTLMSADNGETWAEVDALGSAAPERPYTLGRYQTRHRPDGSVVGGGTAPIVRRSSGGGKRRSSSGGSKGLSRNVESQIRDAAKARGLDADEAIRRARSR